MVQVVKQFVEAVSVFESWFLGQNAVISLEESPGKPKNARNPEIVLMMPVERAGVEND